jgi:hypothetical protein
MLRCALWFNDNLRLHFHLHETCFERPSPWPMPCTAGRTALVIDHNGGFRACELRPVVGNLAAFNYDRGRALRSSELRSEAEAIPRDQCWCTHSCFIHNSSKFSPRVLLFAIPWAWWKQRRERPDSAAPLDEMERYKSLELA